jgi:UDP-N-acetylglucosamine transferase subunit ALG13
MADGGTGGPVVFVTVGTDHHRFDRLLGWVERWAATYDGEVVVQYGSNRAPAGVTGHDFLSIQQMQKHFRRAIAVVCAGGPGTIMSARADGCVPIVVPRQAALHEAVDDHQHAFADLMDERSMARVAHDEAGLVALLGEAVADPSRFRFDPGVAPPPEGIDRTGELIDDLLRTRPPRSTRPSLLRRLIGGSSRRRQPLDLA